MPEAQEGSPDVAAFIDWLVEQAPKHGWDQAVIDSRMEYPKELLRLGQKIIDRTPPSKRFDLPPFVWDVMELVGKHTHELNTFQSEAAQHYFTKYTPR
ncbi:hypothetical protein [Streptomyces sp. NPDC059788]|uniref:hypothetical protein n=1 Tax=Streptomyces sp. NPDC059788 TaxID=3346948 RepID=UPI0036528721